MRARVGGLSPSTCDLPVAVDHEIDDGCRGLVIAEDRGNRLFENTRELPRAFVPREVVFERESERVLAAMKGSEEFSSRAWIETDEIAPGYLVNGRGHVLVRRAGLAYELEAAMDTAGWVVVSATHWKG